MRWRCLLAICVVGATAHAEPGAAPGKGYALISCGILPAELVTWSSGETWWGVFASGSGFTLQPATLRVTPCRDPYAEEGELQSGRETTIEGGGQPLFLVKGLKNPVAGPLLTVFQGTLRLMPLVDPEFGMGVRQEVWFVVRGEQKPLAEAKQHHGDVVDYSLTVTKGQDGRKSQLVARSDALWSDGIPRLLWVGDLDRDGSLDFLLDNAMHYALANTQLYLSSEAPDTEVAAPVATMPFSGC